MTGSADLDLAAYLPRTHMLLLVLRETFGLSFPTGTRFRFQGAD